jgi:Raf kinase inhibitor-like YbhB/YbcL family protein
MRGAYAMLGLAWLIIIAGLSIFLSPHHTPPADTSSMATSTLSLTSSAFSEGASIPSKYTCDGQQQSPELSIAGVPTAAKSLALVMDDPDVPKQLKSDGVFDHWVLFNIPPDTTAIAEGGTVGTAGANGSGKNAYTGPCPPPQYEPSEHRYIFTLYALDDVLPLQAGASKADVLQAMQGHIIAQAQLTGRYRRQ